MIPLDLVWRGEILPRAKTVFGRCRPLLSWSAEGGDGRSSFVGSPAQTLEGGSPRGRLDVVRPNFTLSPRVSATCSNLGYETLNSICK